MSLRVRGSPVVQRSFIQTRWGERFRSSAPPDFKRSRPIGPLADRPYRNFRFSHPYALPPGPAAVKAGPPASPVTNPRACGDLDGEIVHAVATPIDAIEPR